MGSIYNQFRSGYRLGIEWTESNTNITNNTTDVTVSVFLQSTGSSYSINSSASKTVTLTIDGTTYTYSAKGLANLAGNQKKTLYSKKLTITHNADGKKAIAVSASFTLNATLSGTYWGTVYCPASGTYSATLSRVPRPSTSSISGTCNVGNTVTIYTNCAANDYLHTLQYSVDGGGTFAPIASGVGASTSWVLPAALANAIPNKTSGSAILRTETYLSGTLIGTKDITFAYSVTAEYARPSCTLTASQVNVAGFDMYVSSESTVTLHAVATMMNNATPKRYIFTIGNNSYTVESTEATCEYIFLLPASQSSTLVVSVTVADSRGFTSLAASETLVILPYTRPSITSIDYVRGYIDDSTHDFVESQEGECLKITALGEITALGGLNSKAYAAEYKVNSASAYTSLVTITALTDYDFQIEFITDALFSTSSAYIIRLLVTDSFNTSIEVLNVRSQTVLMNFSADGRSICIGGMATFQDTVEIQKNLRPTYGITPTEIPEGDSLDNYTISGWYYGEAVEDASYPIESGHFGLYVEQLGGGRHCQRFRYHDGNHYWAYVRCSVNNAWSAWEPCEVSFRIDTPSASDIVSYIKSTLVDTIYPVGSVYMSLESTSPATLFGGTWEQIQNRFLVAAGSSYSAGDTGGNASQSINVSHKHISPNGYSGSAQGGIAINGTVAGGNGKSYRTSNTDYTGTLSNNVTLYYTGDASVSATINTIPPYYAVYMWRRTA